MSGFFELKIVISGPFGLGSLADEAVLAGLLARLSAAKHEITVLSAHPDQILELHELGNVRAVALPAPGSVLSTPEAWQAMAKAHLVVVATAGTIGDSGNPPARTWLSHAEHARTLEIKSAVVGVGARPIPDARDRTRVQRLLHNFTDCLSARDEASKLALVSYGLSSSRISNNGSPVFALGEKLPKATPTVPRVGLVLAPRIPSHPDFGFEEVHASGPVLAATQALAAGLLQEAGVRLSVFHDHTPAAEKHARALTPKGSEIDAARIDYIPCDRPISEIREAMAACEVIFSCSLHGVILAATAGVPVLGCDAETGTKYILDMLMPGANLAIPAGAQGEPFDVAVALERLKQRRADAATLREKVSARLKLLVRKEAQNGRMLELLVPRRDRWDVDAARDAEKPGKRGSAGKRKRREEDTGIAEPDFDSDADGDSFPIREDRNEKPSRTFRPREEHRKPKRFQKKK